MNNSTKFFHFRQSCCGGNFHFDEKKGISVNVIIEAKNSKEANSCAGNIGIYFKDCKEIGCSCDGRWNKIRNNENGNKSPSVYGKRVAITKKTVAIKYDFDSWMKNQFVTVIHYLNGDVVWIRSVKK